MEHINDFLSRSRPPMEYYWRKVTLNTDGSVKEELPLPNQAILADHNRILKINNVTLYDAGNYTCSVTRPFGRTTMEVKQLILEGTPYFPIWLAVPHISWLWLFLPVRGYGMPYPRTGRDNHNQEIYILVFLYLLVAPLERMAYLLLW